MTSLLLDALQCKNEKRPPVWLMRQAGRYMPQYQKLRARNSLLEMFHRAESIVEVTMLPIDLLGVDAAILFADILSVLDGLGVKWDFVDGKGPVVEKISREKKLDLFHGVYGEVEKAIRELKKELKVPLIGFAGGPFTVASYCIEGGSSKDLKETKKWLYQEPTSFHQLLEKITEATIEYLHRQIASGVDAVQLFDSWAIVLSEKEFESVCLPYLKKIVETVNVPVIVFCRGSCTFAHSLSQLPLQCISLDWLKSIEEMRACIPSTIALQGNLDPMALYGSKSSICEKASQMLEQMKNERGYIFNLGSGILPDTPFDHVKCLVDHVKSY